MNIDTLTIGELKQIQALLGNSQSQSENPYPVGKNVFIRTVTHHYTGRLVQVASQELILEDAAWIADDGRFTQALSTGQFAEVEMFPKGRVVIGRGSICDVSEITTVPCSQK